MPVALAPHAIRIVHEGAAVQGGAAQRQIGIARVHFRLPINGIFRSNATANVLPALVHRIPFAVVAGRTALIDAILWDAAKQFHFRTRMPTFC